MTKIAAVQVSIALVAATMTFGDGAAAQTLKGVNLAGAAYSPAKLPGIYGQDFVYPTDREMKYFAEKGMNVFRISVLWERLQPTLGGNLDMTELARLSDLIDQAEQLHASVIINIHNYGPIPGRDDRYGNSAEFRLCRPMDPAGQALRGR